MNKMCYFCEKTITNGTACCDLCWYFLLRENDRRIMRTKCYKKEIDKLRKELDSNAEMIKWYQDAKALFGCDCGCGGDYMEEIMNKNKRLIKEITKLCKLSGKRVRY